MRGGRPRPGWQTAVEVHDERLKAVTEQGQRLVDAGHFASDSIVPKLAQLRDERAALGDKLDARRKEVRVSGCVALAMPAAH